MSQSGAYFDGTVASGIETITGNSGGQVGPVLSGGTYTIGLTASGGFTVIGTPGSHVLNMAPTGWTAGSVVFASSATAFSQDNANFFYDSGTSSLLLGTTTPISASILTMNSTTKGFRPPSMTTVQKNAIGSPVAGLVLYDNTLNDLQYYNGASWVSSAGVTSITGTANQISASSATGAVTLSFPNGISIGSYQATSPPTGGIIAPGTVAFGTNSPDGTTQMQVTTSLGQALKFTGTQTSNNGVGNQRGFDIANTYAPVAGSGSVYVVDIHPTFAIPVAQSVTDAACYRATPSYTGNLGAIPISYGFYYDGGNALPGGTLTVSYGGYFANPAAGTTRVALHSDNLTIGSSYINTAPPTDGAIIQGNTSIGTTSNANKLDVSGSLALGSYAGTAAPSNGMIVSGRVGIGTNAPSSTAVMELDLQSSLPIGIYVAGTSTAVTGSVQVEYWSASIFNPTNGASACAFQFLNGTVIAPSTKTITLAAGSFVQLNLNSNVGTITDAIGVYVSPGSVGAGTITRATGLKVVTPTAGSTNICAAFDGGISVGNSYVTTAAPTSGAIIQGQVGIGVSSVTNVKMQVFPNVAAPIPTPGTGSGAISLHGDSTTYGLFAGVINTGNCWLQAMRNDSNATTYNIFLNPAGGYTGALGLSIGSSYYTTTPPSSGAIIEGKVGIGTNNPQTSLQVGGDYVSGVGNIHIRPASGNSSYLTFTENAVLDKGGIGFDNGSGTMKLVTGGLPGVGTAYLTITSTGVVEIVNRMKYDADSTGAGSAALGANCPATTLTAPYTWMSITSSDGSVIWVPGWK